MVTAMDETLLETYNSSKMTICSLNVVVCLESSLYMVCLIGFPQNFIET